MIGDLRRTLAGELRAVLDVPVFDGWPDRVSPPLCLVTPPLAQWVSGGRAFGEYVVSVDVVLLVEKATPDVALQRLEALTETVLANSQDWALPGVDGPATVGINGVEHLGTVIHLQKASRL